MTNIIDFKNVSKIYKNSKAKALDNVNLKIRKSEFFCLVGASGSGKSTILKLIAGLEKPTQGSVESANSIGMVFQLGALMPWLTVEENVVFGLKMKGVPKENRIAHKYLEVVKLENFEKKYPRELSGGQRQRVGIARALAIDPEVLLLDEPFSALDPLTTEDLYLDLLGIWEKTQKTIVMVSHYFEESVLLADRVGCIRNGKLKGIIEINLRRPRNVRSKEFVRKTEEIKSLIS